MREYTHIHTHTGNLNKEKGITLIALVITIIVLLILAGVAITTLTGENNLLERARIAKEKTEQATKEEQDNFKNIENILNNRSEMTGITNDADLIEFLSKTNYKLTLKDAFTSKSAITNILKSNENIDYIINNKDKYIKYIINDENVLGLFVSNEYAMNKMIENSGWTQEILNSEMAIGVLDNSNPSKVPTMTSNTAPSGEAFASSAYSGYPAYQAFNGSSSGYWGVGAGLSYKDQYIGYDFVNPIWVYKIETQFAIGKQDTDYVIEASNDKENWDIIKDNLHESGNKETIIPNNYNKKYRYYRLRMLSEVVQSGSGNTVITLLQFYGK